ncbi:hypothetical protein HY570_02995 [Candidatus Micrarchaeota archaeon]|nr:hypothetical protein [Candidatus Micrarchaeota archaeon]
MLKFIREITKRYFDGVKRKGPRHEYLLKELKRRGCNPSLDKYGNIWVQKGSGNKVILYSSHVDVDPRIPHAKFKSYKSGRKRILSGVLDNSIGCYLNLLLAQEGPKRGRAIYIFTASEEADKKNPRRFGLSAREVLKELKKRKITPDLCVAVDVTYPKLLTNAKRIEWHKEHHEIFDLKDPLHCYLDGYSNHKSKKIGSYFLRRFNSPHVSIRKLSGYDEAHVYRSIAPSFAFGPIVYGHFDRPNQKMPLIHAKTALKFLRKISEIPVKVN